MSWKLGSPRAVEEDNWLDQTIWSSSWLLWRLSGDQSW